MGCLIRYSDLHLEYLGDHFLVVFAVFINAKDNVFAVNVRMKSCPIFGPLGDSPPALLRIHRILQELRRRQQFENTQGQGGAEVVKECVGGTLTCPGPPPPIVEADFWD